MRKSIYLAVVLIVFFRVSGRGEDPPKPIFPDKNLEKAVRKFVFEKRDNDKPLVEADLLNLSIVQANGMDISDLTGLEKCQNLASLELARNKVKDLSALRGMERLQFLNVAKNEVEDITP